MGSSVIESTTESNIFWSSIIVADLIWIAFFLINFFTFNFKWMVKNFHLIFFLTIIKIYVSGKLTLKNRILVVLTKSVCFCEIFYLRLFVVKKSSLDQIYIPEDPANSTRNYLTILVQKFFSGVI